MNITRNISYVGPGSSCSYLGARPPSLWKDTNSTDAACSVANCLDNSQAIQKCCTGGTVESFNETIPNAGGNMTIEGQWLYCALPGVNASGYDGFEAYNPKDPYQAYQDCLVREGTEFLTCNQPSRYRFGSGESSCYGGGTSITTPGGIAANDSSHPEQVCTVNTDIEGGVGQLLSCCDNSNGTVRAELAGCQVSCSGGSGLQTCLSGNARLGRGPGFTYLCSNYSRDGKHSGAAEGVSVGSGKLTIMGALVLSTFMFAAL